MPLTGNDLEGFRFLSLCNLLCFFIDIGIHPMGQ